MLPSPDQPLLKALLDSWDRNHTILLNLLRILPAGGLAAKATESSPTVAQMFAHMHYVRMVLVQEDAPECARPYPTREERAAERDPGRLAQWLDESARVVRAAVRGRLESGRPMDRHYDHPVLMLQHLLWHEGYHHGQIKLALKVAAIPLADEVAGPVTWGVWMDKHEPPSEPVGHVAVDEGEADIRMRRSSQRMIMAMQRTAATLGRHVYGAGVMALGTVGLVGGDFVSGQPVPKSFPGRAVLAYVAAGFLLAAGSAVQWRRTAAGAAAALTVYVALVVVVLMNGRVLLAHYAEFGAYFGAVEQLSLAAGALVVFAAAAKIDAALAARLTRAGQGVFGLCALYFGAAHFLFMNLAAPLVPKWLPPSQEFWGYATGVGFVAAGAALLSGVQARLAAILLTVMLASFALLVHAPMLLSDPASRTNWSEAALNLAITGVAWVVADRLRLASETSVKNPRSNPP